MEDSVLASMLDPTFIIDPTFILDPTSILDHTSALDPDSASADPTSTLDPDSASVLDDDPTFALDPVTFSNFLLKNFTLPKLMAYIESINKHHKDLDLDLDLDMKCPLYASFSTLRNKNDQLSILCSNPICKVAFLQAFEIFTNFDYTYFTGRGFRIGMHPFMVLLSNNSLDGDELERCIIFFLGKYSQYEDINFLKDSKYEGNSAIDFLLFFNENTERRHIDLFLPFYVLEDFDDPKYDGNVFKSYIIEHFNC
jgi:hypothetical protein